MVIQRNYYTIHINRTINGWNYEHRTILGIWIRYSKYISLNLSIKLWLLMFGCSPESASWKCSLCCWFKKKTIYDLHLNIIYVLMFIYWYKRVVLHLPEYFAHRSNKSTFCLSTGPHILSYSVLQIWFIVIWILVTLFIYWIYHVRQYKHQQQ